MSFSKQQLQKFANLIRIEISDEKLSEMNIDSIIEWLDKLQKIDTRGVEPMLSPVEHALPRRKVLANAPDSAGVSRGYFAVPKVMDE